MVEVYHIGVYSFEGDFSSVWRASMESVCMAPGMFVVVTARLTKQLSSCLGQASDWNKLRVQDNHRAKQFLLLAACFF